MLEQVLHSLATAGPLALVLGYACWTLWSKLSVKDAALAAALDAKEKAHLEQEEKMRADFRSELAAERSRSDAVLTVERERHSSEEDELRGELVAALKSVAAAMKGNV